MFIWTVCSGELYLFQPDLVLWCIRWPPQNQLLVLGMFKLSYSTPFTHFLCLVFVCQPFHLCFILKHSPTLSLSVFNSFCSSSFLSNQPFTCKYCLYRSSSFYTSLPSLWSSPDPVCLLCTASCVKEGWDPGGWCPLQTTVCRIQYASLAWASPRQVVDPVNQLVMFCPNLD